MDTLACAGETVNGKTTKTSRGTGVAYFGSELEPRQWSFWERRLNQE